ncbi:hypothetical protein GCM10029992_19270 [Glycomyces albus]
MNTPRLRRPARWLAVLLGAALTATGFTFLAGSAHAAVETGRWYSIVNEHSGLAVDIEARSTANGATALLWTPTEASNQQFRFVDAGDGYYRIEARHSGRVLDVYAKSADNGADVVQWANNGGTNQQWQLNEQSNGTYEIVNRNSGKALDNWEAATEPGARLSQYDRTGSAAQRWRLTPADDGDQPGDGSAFDPNLQYYGRWADDGSWRTMGWAGGYVEAAFTGSAVGVHLRGTIDMYYSIDGAPERWMRNVSGDVTVASGLSGSHTIRIGFRELAGSYTGDPAFGGFVVSGGETLPIARPEHHIEYIGDSITVGQPNGDRPFTTYPWLTAEALGASHMQVAEGGACVSTTDCRGMVEWFLRTDNQDFDRMWDFSTYDTDVVVINLGTNNKVSAAEFEADYLLLLERARQAYPDAEILAMGVFRERLLTEVQNAVADRNAAGDQRVHYVDTTGWVDPATDTHDNVHPTDAGHRRIADLLIPVVDQYL